MLFKKAIVLILFGALATSLSCISDVDFNQADELLLAPVIESSIIHTEQAASHFLENGNELVVVRDSIGNIEIFEDEFVINNLIRAELFFEVTNSINRSFSLQLNFLDENEEVQHTLTFDADASPNGNDIITNYEENFEDDSLNALKTTRIIAVEIRLNPSDDGSMLDENSMGRVLLQSKGVFYLEIGT
ncbi:hypothetical protein [uncultured Winogradskyella sp.]|uniref:hypothetical protein n=1 Tax=uncultured Winogradskyella sp. TaxID=395353 RepID=UPI002625ADDD|nr:hypothetical protein [uncultured Winogradskyella sp.]